MGGRKIKLVKVGEDTKKTSSEEIQTAETTEKKVKRPTGPRIKKIRGKKHQAAVKKVESRSYPLAEAVKLAKEASTAGFDASIDTHINLGLDKDKPEHKLRSFLALPHGTGKSVRVLVFAEAEAAKKAQEAGADIIGDEALIEEIAQGKFPPADAVIATPSFMPKLAKIARFLGPKGLMPTPKAGTVAEDPTAMVGELKQGRVEIRTEAVPVVHVSIGKVSSPDQDLADNLKAVVAELNRVRPLKVPGVFIQSVYLAPTMGPSVKVDLASLT